MGEYVRVSGTVVSHIGIVPDENNDNFYINGRFSYEHESHSVQVSLDNEETGFLFAVMDSMEKYIDEKSMNLSMSKELRKFHKRIIEGGKGIQVKVDQLCELTEEVSNLIFSGNIDEMNSEETPSLAGLIIEENTGIIVNYGTTKAYLLRDGILKKLAGDDNTTESMIKMGIITNEQADIIDEDEDSYTSEEKSAQKSELINLKQNDIFLLCTDGLWNAVDEEKIFEIMSTRNDTGVITNMLIREAVRNSGEDNVTALVVRIDNVNENQEIIKERIISKRKRDANDEEDITSEDINIDNLYDDTFVNIPGSAGPLKLKRMTEEQKLRKHRINLIKRITTLAVIAAMLIVITTITVKWFKSITQSPDDGKDDLTTSYETTTTINETEEITETTIVEETESETTQNSEETTASGEWPKQYTVVSGDTLNKITIKFYDDVSKMQLIIDANDIKDPNNIIIGDEYIIPAPE